MLACVCLCSERCLNCPDLKFMHTDGTRLADAVPSQTSFSRETRGVEGEKEHIFMSSGVISG